MSDAHLSLAPAPPALEQEIGVSFAMPYAVSWDEDLIVHNLDPVPIESLVAMRKKDSQVRALLRLLTLPIRAATRRMSILPAEGGEAEAEFINLLFTLPPQSGGMTVPLEKFISQCLLALNDGFAPFEIVYRSPTEGPLAFKWTIKKLARRPPETCTFFVDRQGGFAGIKQQTSFLGRNVNVKFVPPYVFYYAAQEEENLFYGQSYFLPAFYHYDQKQKLYFITHVAAQFRAVPGRVGTIPSGASTGDKASFKRALTDFGMAQAMIKPPGFEVEEFGKGTSTFDFVELINHHSQMQARSVLAPEQLEAGASRPNVEFNTQSTELIGQVLQSVCTELEAMINAYIIPNLISWNFGTDKHPSFRFAPISDDSKRLIMESFAKLATATSIQTTPEFFHELEKQVAEELGLEIDYEIIDETFDELQQAQQDAELATSKATVATAEHTAANPAPPAAPVAASGKAGDYISLAELHRIHLESGGDGTFD